MGVNELGWEWRGSWNWSGWHRVGWKVWDGYKGLGRVRRAWYSYYLLTLMKNNEEEKNKSQTKALIYQDLFFLVPLHSPLHPYSNRPGTVLRHDPFYPSLVPTPYTLSCLLSHSYAFRPYSPPPLPPPIHHSFASWLRLTIRWWGCLDNGCLTKHGVNGRGLMGGCWGYNHCEVWKLILYKNF